MDSPRENCLDGDAFDDIPRDTLVPAIVESRGPRVGVPCEVLDVFERSTIRPLRHHTTRPWRMSLGLTFSRYWSWHNGASNAVTTLTEEINAKRRRPRTIPQKKRVRQVLLNRLWEQLPDRDRQEIGQILVKMIAQQVLPLDQKEESNE